MLYIMFYIINKFTGQALFYLDPGAHDAMMLLLESLPICILAEGEYYTTVEEWIRLLCRHPVSEVSLSHSKREWRCE